MSSIRFFTPVYYAKPNGLAQTVHNWVERQLDLGGERLFYFDRGGVQGRSPTQMRSAPFNGEETRNKIITWIATAGIWPLLLVVAKWLFRTFHTPFLARDHAGEDVIRLSQGECRFQDYIVGRGSRYGMSRPGVNILQSQLWPIPGEILARKFFQLPADIQLNDDLPDPRITIVQQAQRIRGLIQQNGSIRVSGNQQGDIVPKEGHNIHLNDMSDIYGDSVPRVSKQHLLDILNSQQIYLSPEFPRQFFLALKGELRARRQAAEDNEHLQIGKLPLETTVGEFLGNPEEVIEDYVWCGFPTQAACQAFLDRSLEDVASCVVKIEKCQLLADQNGQILYRDDSPTSFRVIHASQILDLANMEPGLAQSRLNALFTTIFASIERNNQLNGFKFLLFPAIGTEGLSENKKSLYWNAFFDAVIASEMQFDNIFVDPGEEEGPLFTQLLEARFQGAQDDAASQKLFRIRSLHSYKTDLLRLAHSLSEGYMDAEVFLVNPSSPHVTLGSAVGNDFMRSDRNGPDETLAYATTHLLCHEELTQVLRRQGPQRVFHLSPDGAVEEVYYSNPM